MRVLSLLILLVSLFSCSGKSTSKANFNFVVTNQNISVAGGLIIYGKNLSTSESFSRILTGTGEINETLPHGTYFIGAVGWAGNGFTGTTSCAFAQSQVVSGDQMTIDLTLSESNCFSSTVTTDPGHGSPLRFSKSIQYFCDTTLSTLAATANCSYDMLGPNNHKGFIGSFKYLLNSKAGESIASDCYTSDGLNVTAAGDTNDLNIPMFNGNAALSYQIKIFLAADCAESQGTLTRSIVEETDIKVNPYSTTQNNVLVQVKTADVCAISDELNLATGYAAGLGTVNDPFVICSPQQLGRLQANYGAEFANSYVIGRDLDLISGLKAGTLAPTPYSACLNDGDTFIPIGSIFDSSCVRTNSTDGFAGNFDGNHKTIKHFRFSTEEDDAAFFISLGGTGQIVNLTLDKLEIQGGSNTAGLISNSSGIIQNIHVTNSQIRGEGDYAASIVSQQNSGPISSLHAKNNLIEGINHVGGLIGFSTGPINDSSFDGTIDARQGSKVGGIAGAASGLSNCISTGLIDGAGIQLGGLVGESTGIIHSSRSDMFLKSWDTASENKVGGLVGDCNAGCSVISNSFFHGRISTTCSNPACEIGGIAGVAPSVSDSFSVQDLSALGGQDGTFVSVTEAWNQSSSSTFCTGSSFVKCEVGDLPRHAYEDSDCLSSVNNSDIFSGQTALGTQSSPYLICNPIQWAAIDLTSHYKLSQNINLSEMTKLGALSGSLDGNKKIVFGFGGTDSDNKSSLFSSIETTGSVKNLTIAGFHFQTGDTNKNLAALATVNDGTISNVSSVGIDLISSVEPNLIAGLVIDNNGTMSNVKVDGDILAQETIGGIAYRNMGVIEKAMSHLRISEYLEAPSAGHIGGIVGINSKTIRTSTFRGSIRTVDQTVRVGGIAGFMSYVSGSYPSITDSYVDKEGRIQVGATTALVGGIVGSSDNASNSIVRSIFNGVITIPSSNASHTINAINGGAGTPPVQTNTHFYTSPMKEFDTVASNGAGVWLTLPDRCTISISADTVDNASNTFGGVWRFNRILMGELVSIGSLNYDLTLKGIEQSECENILADDMMTESLYRGVIQPQTIDLTLLGSTYDLANSSTAAGRDLILAAYISHLTDPSSTATGPTWIYEEEEGLKLFRFD